MSALTSGASKYSGRLQHFSRGNCCNTRLLELIPRARFVLRAAVVTARSVTFWGILLRTNPTG